MQFIKNILITLHFMVKKTVFLEVISTVLYPIMDKQGCIMTP